MKISQNDLRQGLRSAVIREFCGGNNAFKCKQKTESENNIPAQTS